MCSSEVIPCAASMVSACPNPSSSRPVSRSARRRHSTSATWPSLVRMRRPRLFCARTSTTSPLLPTCCSRPSTVPQVRRNSRTRSPAARARSYSCPAMIDRPVERLVAADLAACLKPLANGKADVGHVLVGRCADGDAALRARAQQDVAPLRCRGRRSARRPGRGHRRPAGRGRQRASWRAPSAASPFTEQAGDLPPARGLPGAWW